MGYRGGEAPGIAPGTPNLAALQTGAGPLAALTDQPLRIDWKPAGEDPSYYRLVRNYEVLPDLQPRAAVAGWEFRREVIWLTPCSIAVDLRVRGQFAPPPLTDESSVLSSHPRIGYVVAYGAAALVATVRGNDPWVRQYGQKALEGMDEILEQLVRAKQGQVRRSRAAEPAILSITKEKPGRVQEQSLIIRVAAGRVIFTVFVQLTFSGSLVRGGYLESRYVE